MVYEGAAWLWCMRQSQAAPSYFLLLGARAGGSDVGVSIGELGEVLRKAARQFTRLAVIGRTVLPGVAWAQHTGGHIRALGWHAQAKDGVCPGLYVFQRAGDGGAHHRAGIGQADALSDAIGATAPAGIDQI